jgi:hypothetical protein
VHAGNNTTVNSGHFTSNPIRLQLQYDPICGSSSSPIHSQTLIFKIQHVSQQSFGVMTNDNTTFTTVCMAGDSASESSTVFTCPLTGATVTHKCNGTGAYNLVTLCPAIVSRPSCSKNEVSANLENINANSEPACSVANYTSTYTTRPRVH